MEANGKPFKALERPESSKKVLSSLKDPPEAPSNIFEPTQLPADLAASGKISIDGPTVSQSEIDKSSPEFPNW